MASWGERNNNPGCIKGRHYNTLEEGYEALNGLLIRGYNNRTAYDVFKKYAPYSDGNNPREYANFVIKKLRERGVRDKNGQLVNASTRFDFTDPTVRAEFTMAISRMETGKILGGEKTAIACANAYQKKSGGLKQSYASVRQLAIAAPKARPISPAKSKTTPSKTTTNLAQQHKPSIRNTSTKQDTELEKQQSFVSQQEPVLANADKPSWWRRNMPSWLGGMSKAEKAQLDIQERIDGSAMAFENKISNTNLTQTEQTAVNSLYQKKLGLKSRLGDLGTPVVLTSEELQGVGLSNQDISQLRGIFNQDRGIG